MYVDRCLCVFVGATIAAISKALQKHANSNHNNNLARPSASHIRVCVCELGLYAMLAYLWIIERSSRPFQVDIAVDKNWGTTTTKRQKIEMHE